MTNLGWTPVGEVMTAPVLTVGPDDPVSVAVELFAQYPIHHLPVVSDNKLVGMMSQQEILRLEHNFSLFKNQWSQEVNDAIYRSLLIGEVMTKQVATISPADRLDYAFGYFQENRFHALPVVDENKKVVGILSTYDLLTYAYGRVTTE